MIRSRRLSRLLVPLAVMMISGCDLLNGHGSVDVVNGTNKHLVRVVLEWTEGAEEGGALDGGGTVHFTGIPSEPVNAYGYYAGSTVADVAASGEVVASGLITLTLAPTH